MNRKLLSLFFMFCLSACVHKPAIFEEKGESQVHKDSGEVVRLEIGPWLENPELRKENQSPEVLVSLYYEYRSDSNDWKPAAILALCREKSTSNLKLIENRLAVQFQSAKLIKTETMKLKMHRSIILSLYSHTEEWSRPASSGTRTVTYPRVLTYFATPSADSKRVVAVTILGNSLKQKRLAMDFIEKALFQISSKQRKK